MSKQKTLGGVLLLAAMLLFVIAANGAGRRLVAYAAPAAAITPVGQSQPVKGERSNIIPILLNRAVTADGSECRDTRDWIGADLQTNIDIGTVNTTTVTLQHSNDNAHYTDGPTLANAVTADMTDLNRYDLYGAYTCLAWDVTTTDTVTITVRALLYR